MKMTCVASKLVLFFFTLELLLLISTDKRTRCIIISLHVTIGFFVLLEFCCLIFQLHDIDKHLLKLNELFEQVHKMIIKANIALFFKQKK